MRIHFTAETKILGVTLAALSLFASGYVAGQNKFGQPKTIIHMVILKWRPGVADADKHRALEGGTRAVLDLDPFAGSARSDSGYRVAWRQSLQIHVRSYVNPSRPPLLSALSR